MRSLRVATYNVYLGADLTLIFGAQDPTQLIARAQLVHQQLLATDFPARAEAMARLIVRERIDVIGLQEVARWSLAAERVDGTPGEPVLWCDFLEVLLEALERAGAAYDAHALNANFEGTSAISLRESMSVLGHNVVLVRRGSRVQVTDTATGRYAASLDVPTGMDELVLRVVRSWGWVDAVVDGSAFRFVNTHTEAHDMSTRNAQRDELLSAIGQPVTPVLVVGDLNAAPGAVGMPPAYTDAWIAAGGHPGGGHTCGQAADLTNPVSLLVERIDYIWVRGAQVDTCKVIGGREVDRTARANLWPSDHAGVVATVRV